MIRTAVGVWLALTGRAAASPSTAPSGPAALVVVSSGARRAFVPASETTTIRWNVCARGKIEQKPKGLRLHIKDEIGLRAIDGQPVAVVVAVVMSFSLR
jgi:hypothetical protein